MTPAPQPPAAGSEPRYLLVGTVRKPHGIKGELVVWLETDRVEAVFRPGRTLRVGDTSGRPTGATLTVERVRPFKDGILLKPTEHSTRTEATDQLRGCSLLIPEAEAEPLEEGEVFYHQLVGMNVVAAGETVGTIRDVYEAAAGDLLVVRRADGSELIVPFVREMVREIRLDDRLLVIDPPEGLLDL